MATHISVRRFKITPNTQVSKLQGFPFSHLKKKPRANNSTTCQKKTGKLKCNYHKKLLSVCHRSRYTPTTHLSVIRTQPASTGPEVSA